MPLPFHLPFQFPLFGRGAAQPQEAPAAPQTPPNPPSLSSSLSSAPSPTPSTVSDVQSHARSLLHGDSSIYADSPALSSRSTPKPPSFAGFRRALSTPGSISPGDGLPRDITDSQAPLHQPHSAGPYRPAILYSPQHDSPVPPPAAYTRDSSLYEGVDPETAHLAVLVNQRAKKRQRKAWVRRRNSRRTTRGHRSSRTPVRKKAILCLGSGIFLSMVLTTYLSIALTRPHTGQEVHVLFILIILSTTVLFCHSLVRLCMMSFGRGDERPRIPDMAGPDGFEPERPIRVHLARDEELGLGDDDSPNGAILDPEKEILKAPPPAYGLWRSSVPINPDLLHWQRVDKMNPLRQNPASASPVNATAQPNGLLDPFQTPIAGRQQQHNRHQNDEGEPVPRPPSYVSDDGVRYVVEAAPRSVAPALAHEDSMSDVHPAYRGGLGVR